VLFLYLQPRSGRNLLWVPGAHDRSSYSRRFNVALPRASSGIKCTKHLHPPPGLFGGTDSISLDQIEQHHFLPHLHQFGPGISQNCNRNKFGPQPIRMSSSNLKLGHVQRQPVSWPSSPYGRTPSPSSSALRHMKDVLIIISCIVRFVKGTVHHVCIFTFSLFTIDLRYFSLVSYNHVLFGGTV